MERKEYSAGIVKLPFWFAEFKKMVNLVNSGMTLPEIKELNEKENIFLAASQARSIQTFNTVATRLTNLDSSFYSIFEQCDIDNQKLIVLIAIMQSDTLFFDFMYEVFREKLIIGINELTNSDFTSFFKDKQIQSERVASWQDYTLKRLAGAYKTFLTEAGILERSTNIINKPIINHNLENNLKSTGKEIFLKILKGER